jgi:hypothetical protein
LHFNACGAMFFLWKTLRWLLSTSLRRLSH